MLIISGSSVAIGDAHFGYGTGPIHMDNLVCTGRETNIATCQFAGYGNNNCDHDEDVGVICNARE